MVLVTNDGWFVSTLTGSSIDGVILHVFKTREGVPLHRHFRYGDHNNRRFNSNDEASQFALEHGYLQPFLQGDVATFKLLHKSQLKIMLLWTRKAVMEAKTKQDIVRLADNMAHWVRAIRRDKAQEEYDHFLLGSTYACGVYTMARRLRPDLMK